MRTFVLRIFEPAPGAADVGLRGVVVDVREGSTELFEGEAELLDIIGSASVQPAPSPPINAPD